MLHVLQDVRGKNKPSQHGVWVRLQTKTFENSFSAGDNNELGQSQRHERSLTLIFHSSFSFSHLLFSCCFSSSNSVKKTWESMASLTEIQVYSKAPPSPGTGFCSFQCYPDPLPLKSDAPLLCFLPTFTKVRLFASPTSGPVSPTVAIYVFVIGLEVAATVALRAPLTVHSPSLGTIVGVVGVTNLQQHGERQTDSRTDIKKRPFGCSNKCVFFYC